MPTSACVGIHSTTDHANRRRSQLQDRAHGHYGAGRYAQALSLYSRLLPDHPEDPYLLARCGLCLLQMEQWGRAAALFQLALGYSPDLAEAIQGLAIVQAHRGQPEAALTGFLKLYRLHPESALVAHNIGIALNRLERYSQAVPWFSRALTLAPERVDTWVGLAAAREELGEAAAAREAIDHAMALTPEAPFPRLMRLMLALPAVAQTEFEASEVAPAFSRALGDLSGWVNQDWRHWVSLGGVVGDRQPFLLAYRPGNHCESLGDYGNLMAKAARAYWHDRGLLPVNLVPSPSRARPRLGVLCAHIRRHSVWDIILKGLLRHLLRTRFELIVYHTGTEVDAETQWAERHAERFVGGPRSPTEWLELIRADAPDVLYFPELGMDPLATKLGALRLAPLQAASWGHPITTGLPDIDLFFSGQQLEPPAAQDHYRERLIQLPGTGVCTEWLDVQPGRLPVGYPRQRERRRVRLLLCQHPFKYAPADMTLLAEVLRACAPCELYVLKHRRLSRVSDQAANLLRRAVIDAGLDADALLIERPWVDRDQFLSLLEAVDIYLDLPAFSGYTTAWQALHCGLPIVTLEGPALRQRLASGLLRQIGQVDTIARDRAAYIAIAAQLAEESRDPVLNETRRAALMAAAVQADHQVSAVRAFEEALMKAL